MLLLRKRRFFPRTSSQAVCVGRLLDKGLRLHGSWVACLGPEPLAEARLCLRKGERLPLTGATRNPNFKPKATRAQRSACAREDCGASEGFRIGQVSEEVARAQSLRGNALSTMAGLSAQGCDDFWRQSPSHREERGGTKALQGEGEPRPLKHTTRAKEDCGASEGFRISIIRPSAMK